VIFEVAFNLAARRQSKGFIYFTVMVYVFLPAFHNLSVGRADRQDPPKVSEVVSGVPAEKYSDILFIPFLTFTWSERSENRPRFSTSLRWVALIIIMLMSRSGLKIWNIS